MNEDRSGFWPADSFEDAHVREVFARYGLAMYQAQVLEQGIINALFVHEFVPQYRGKFSTRSEYELAFDNFYERQFGLTFGNLCRRLERTNRVSQPTMDLVRATKVDRDRLAHRFFRQCDQAFANPRGRHLMILWCEDALARFRTADEELSREVTSHYAEWGISQELIDQTFDEFLSNAEKWKANKLPDDKS